MARGVILFGHGSRDPLWKLPIENVAARLRAAEPGTQVGCAWLELEAPNLPAAAAAMVAAGADRITVVPMFLGTGRHAREDLPPLVERIRAAHPAVVFALQRPVGKDDRVLELMARIALE